MIGLGCNVCSISEKEACDLATIFWKVEALKVVMLLLCFCTEAGKLPFSQPADEAIYDVE